VNYWPARTAMAWWPRFDPGEVADDFARIADAGMDSVRLFLRWEDVQPRPEAVDTTVLGHLVTVADLAEGCGLDIMPTLFTGHMSGVNWIPTWALGGTARDRRFRVVAGGRVVDEGLRNWYRDPAVAEAQALLASRAAAALAGHPALWAWDLGNENSNCVVPPDRASARSWLGRMTSAIRGADPGALVTIGLHMEDLEQDRCLGPAEAAEVCDFLTMHGYPIYASWSGGPTDEHLVGFLARVTRWLGGGSEVLFSEFGLPTRRPSDGLEPAGRVAPTLVDEAEAAEYTGKALDGLLRAGCTGAMLWCHADYAPAIWSAPPLDEAVHERSFGLWRADGSAKPAVEVVRAHAGALRRAAPDDGWIDVDQERFWARPEVELPRLYRRYRDRV